MKNAFIKILFTFILIFSLILQGFTIAGASETASVSGKNQTLQNENIAIELLNKDNAYTVELSGKFKQDINKDVQIKLCDDIAFRDCAIIVGKPLEIEGLRENAKLSFKFRSNISKINDKKANKGYYSYLICGYNNGKVEFFKTVKSNIIDNTISAEISKSGIYYIIDVNKLKMQYDYIHEICNRGNYEGEMPKNIAYGEDIADMRKHIVFLDGPAPKPVTLKAAIVKGGMTDTDGDEILDVDEVDDSNVASVWNVGALISMVTGGQIDLREYGQINLYNYSSNPTLIDSDYDGINDIADEKPLNNLFAGKMVNDYMVERIDSAFEMKVDYRDFFSNNQIYNKNLAIMSSVFASDVYDACYFVVESGGRISSLNENDKLYKLFGMKDVENIKISPDEYSNDKDDISEFVICHRNTMYNGVSREIVFLIIRGTNGSNAEWTSNFDIGADSPEYYQANGYTHKDWTNKKNHKGFDVTANRILKKVDDYFAKQGLQGADIEKSILITGHSRGGAIANLLGAHFEKQEGFYPYTYTFACPNVTTSKEIANYKTIFNIVNTDDIITYLNMEEWGFGKYGTTYEISVSSIFGRVDEENAGVFEKTFGKQYMYDDKISRTLEYFADIVNSREELYILDSSSDGFVNIGNKAYTTIEKAQERKNEIEKMFRKAKLLKYTKLTIKDGILGLKYVEVNYSPAYFMQNLANIASTTENPGPLIGYDTAGKYTKAKISFAANNVNIFERSVTGVVHPHMPATYYLIVHNSDINQ